MDGSMPSWHRVIGGRVTSQLVRGPLEVAHYDAADFFYVGCVGREGEDGRVEEYDRNDSSSIDLAHVL
ncbi:hypothetical protein GWI33_014308 [Rhynchophorus ferrugineus]|uniref:Uncharacterized protein n=1 Tax=Rhynchophorus ferrugineus TaxID=354439 RepID=A0A834I1W9_RHYFE|nr:hypothetical protein GWI33_014308 [Rhynchophorus ferrugineus]